MTLPPEPRLGAPGAGLPTPELFVAKWLFAWQRWRGDRASFDARFQAERKAIQALTGGCDAETGARRMLIRRLPGLEDSSRYWSVWMTLDHLRIVHLAFTQVIQALARGNVPEGQASTAAVKPSPEATMAVVPAYEESCETLLATVAAVPELKTAVRFVHPWFGALDAAGWHALAGLHMGIHRAQIERILQGERGRSVTDTFRP